MLINSVNHVSFDSFQSQTRGKRVVLLYPWSDYRNLLLSHFLNDVQDGLLYYRIPASASSLNEWLGGLLDELRSVRAGFGDALKQALYGGDARELGDALAADLAAFRDERIVLYLDELDRVPHDADFRAFITALVDNLPPKTQLAVNSRLLTAEPWTKWARSGEAVVLGTAPRRGNLLFSTQSAPKPQLVINAFGPGQAICDGRVIDSWEGLLPRNLFFYFIDQPQVSRQQVFEIFWSKLSKKDATNVFHVTKRKITERISAHIDDDENYELTSYASGFYVPSDKLMRHYDVADFESALDGAAKATDPRERECLFAQAVEIYRAPYLQDTNLPWVRERREQLQRRFAEALIGLGDLRAERGDWNWALGSYIRALNETPLREDVHRKAISMYLRLGRADEARQHFAALERSLKRELGIAPCEDTARLLSA